MRDLIILRTENMQLDFKGHPYKQIDGIAMSSPSGPTMTDVFFGMIEKQMRSPAVQFTMCMHYLKDILVFNDEKSFIKFLDHLNNI